MPHQEYVDLARRVMATLLNRAGPRMLTLGKKDAGLLSQHPALNVPEVRSCESQVVNGNARLDQIGVVVDEGLVGGGVANDDDGLH